jgi:glutathione synthase/RimK-type ligase-like ATP-grasp enzyme
MDMTAIKVTLQRIRSDGITGDHTLWIQENILRRWGISTHASINLRFGALKTVVRVMPLRKPGHIRISDALASRMGVMNGLMLRMAYRASQATLVLGPVIGILVARVIENRPDRLFGNITAWCKEIALACQQQGAFVYFLTPGGIGSDPSSVKGWTYAGGWVKGQYPIPDVLHNRLNSRKLENLVNVQKHFRESKAKHNTQVFNEKYLNKTEVFSALSKETTAARYLPESHAVTGLATIKSMCAKHRTVFLKPVRGSLGIGIIRIKRSVEGGYVCHYSASNGTRTITYPTLARMVAALTPRLKRQRFQIQRGLVIASVDHRPLDFRALVQKGLSGTWELTSIVGRIAGPNHFVSNLAKGGTIAQARAAIARSNIPSHRKAAVLYELKQAALTIAKGIDVTIDAHFGELGIDLAVDQSGRVWLLEVNSKPSKHDHTQLSEGRIRPSVKMLVMYARHLSRL